VAIHDETTELVTRAMEAGVALTKIFEQGVASGAISDRDMFDTNYVEIAGAPGAVPHQRSWSGGPARCAIPGSLPRQGNAHGVLRMIDTNGYLPVHNKIYRTRRSRATSPGTPQQPQPPPSFNDAAGLAAGRNLRAYLVQSYAATWATARP